MGSPWGIAISGGHHFASGDIALPLVEYLLPTTREKILRGEFVDFFSKELEKKDKDLLDDREKKILKSQKADRTWADWLPGFLVYARVIARLHPWRSDPVIQCLNIIYKAY